MPLGIDLTGLDMIFVGKPLPDNAVCPAFFGEIFVVLVGDGPDYAIFNRHDRLFRRDAFVETVHGRGEISGEHQPEVIAFFAIFSKTAENALFYVKNMITDLVWFQEYLFGTNLPSLSRLEKFKTESFRHAMNAVHDIDDGGKW